MLDWIAFALGCSVVGGSLGKKTKAAGTPSLGRASVDELAAHLKTFTGLQSSGDAPRLFCPSLEW